MRVLDLIKFEYGDISIVGCVVWYIGSLVSAHAIVVDKWLHVFYVWTVELAVFFDCIFCQDWFFNVG